jgi:hypothetical protein
VIIKEDVDRRGRAPGEIAELLTEGWLRVDWMRRASRCCTRKAKRCDRGLDLLGEEDLLVIHADKVPGTLALVRERAVQSS